jgi:threonine dehydrogenase-like Zn-dependent dehydrogenase
MPTKMQAAVVTAFKKPLEMQEWDVPTPGPGQILVKTEACGVCHTDLHAANGDWPLKPTPPFIPGHEAIGIVVALGAGVTIVKEGDRVGVPWLYSACGHCEYCLSAWETVCDEAKFGGYTQNGGFAEYVLASPPTRGSRKPRRGLENGSRFPVAAASATWPSNTPRRWGSWSAASISRTASLSTPSVWAPIWSSTPRLMILPKS